MSEQGSLPTSPAVSVAETIVTQATGQAPEAAPVTQPQVEPKKPEDDFAKKFAALSRKEKFIQEQAQRLKSESSEIERAKRIRELAKTDPLKYLEESGLSLNELLERAAKHGEPPAVEDKVKDLEAKLAAWEKAKEDERVREEQKKKTEAEEKAVNHFKSEIKSKVEANPERYETILKTDSLDEVYNLCDLWYQETREILDIEEAAQKVEDQLLSYAEKFAQVNKFAQKLKAPVQDGQVAASLEPTRRDPEAEQKTVSAPPTLNSKTTAEPSVQSRRLSREQSLSEAAKLIKWS